MAQRVIRSFIDDIDGSEAERTFTFAVDGTNYEIDLSSENIREFNDAIAGFVESARKIRGASTPGRRPRSSASMTVRQSREQVQAIRDWARQNGYEVSDRGRIPLKVQEAFDSSHSGQAASAPEPAMAPAYHNADVQIGWA